jgi:hypothetical protein
MKKRMICIKDLFWYRGLMAQLRGLPDKTVCKTGAIIDVEIRGNQYMVKGFELSKADFNLHFGNYI